MILAWVWGCGSETAKSPEPVAFCEAGPELVYEPSPDAYFTTWPDDFWRVADPETPSGYRLGIGLDEYPGAASFPENFAENFDYATTLDGFGTTPATVFQFTSPVDLRVMPAHAVLAARVGEAWVPWPIDVAFEDAGLSVFLTPRVALPDATEVVAAIWNDGADCLVPSAALQASLTTGASQLDLRRQAAVAELGHAVADVAALTVFTTQSATTVSRAVAEVIAGRDYALAGPAACVPFSAGVLECDAVLPVDDFRDAEHLVPGWDAAVLGAYDLPVRVWRPETPGPFPVMLCGHGLGGSKDDCAFAAELAAAEGWAVVAVDAVEHGDHPAQTVADVALLEPLKIFAIRAIPPGLHGLRLRDNFRQSAWDKLQMIRALQDGIDLDGDGADDLLADDLVYIGASLGGIMGPEPAALSDAIDANLLFVGGGRLTQVIQDSPSFAVLVELMTPPELSEGDVARAFPLLQSLVDAGDPMTFGAHVLDDRFDGATPPHTVLMLAKDDEVVPNSTNANLARALGLPGLGREVWPIDGISFESGPVSGNVNGATAALIEFETVTVGGVPTVAQHDNVHQSEEAAAIVREVLHAVRAGRAPVLTAPAVQ